jgi:hypothetical protein
MSPIGLELSATGGVRSAFPIETVDGVDVELHGEAEPVAVVDPLRTRWKRDPSTPIAVTRGSRPLCAASGDLIDGERLIALSGEALIRRWPAA